MRLIGIPIIVLVAVVGFMFFHKRLTTLVLLGVAFAWSTLR